MADVGIGALGYVGLAKESVEGTRIAPTKFLAANSVSFNDSNDYLNPLQIRGIRDSGVAIAAPYQIAGSMEMAMVAEDIGGLLQSAFAANINSSAYTGGGYTHVFDPIANASPTFSVETSTAGPSPLIMSYNGVRVNTMELKATFGELVMASFGLDGVGRAKQGGAASPTYAASSFYPLAFSGASVDIAGSASNAVKDFTFNVNNNVEHIGTLRTTRSYYRVALGPREMTLSMALDFADTAEYDRLLNDTEFAVSLYMLGPVGVGTSGLSNMSLRIDLPRVKYKTVGVPISASDFITQDVECTVLKPTSATSICTVTLINNQDGATLVT